MNRMPPGVKARLETLKAAKKTGLHVYVAIAPTYPECDETDLRATLEAVKALDPVTIYHEPINIHAKNVVRIQEHIEKDGAAWEKAEVFATSLSWFRYSLESLLMVQRLAEELDVVGKLKLWPAGAMKSRTNFIALRKEAFAKKNGQPELTREQAAEVKAADETAYQQYLDWLQGWWNKVVDWPGQPAQVGWIRPEVPAGGFFVPPEPKWKRLRKQRK